MILMKLLMSIYVELKNKEKVERYLPKEKYDKVLIQLPSYNTSCDTLQVF